ncbi:MAG TPA: hypothetical protein VEV20_11885 [Burkholderiales bacterium]|nr:hypothetical protein [Burkholderiales bacterium]
MSRPIAILLLGALTVLPYAARGQDNDYTDKPPRTQQDIVRERNRACRGLKGEAYNECIANYVGPKRDQPATGGWTRPAQPAKGHGRT